MADNLDNILDWLREGTQVSPEDILIALRMDKFNHLLEQVYAQRFSEASYFPAITEPVKEDNNLRFYLHGFLLDKPRLSFVKELSSDADGWLSVSIIQGGQVTLESINSGWKVTALDVLTPVHGRTLSLKLLLPQVDGKIEDTGRLLLDLSKSSDFSVDIDDDPKLQALTGDLFKDLFEAVDSELRVFPLGEINPGDLPLYLRPHGFALRVMRDSAESGSVLVHIGMKEGFSGRPPSSGQGLKYLHPNTLPNSSVTLLLGIRRTLLWALYRVVEEAFNEPPVIEYDAERLARIKYESLLPRQPSQELELKEGGLAWDIRLDVFDPPGTRQTEEGPDFIIEFEETRGALTWKGVRIQMTIYEFSGMEALPSNARTRTEVSTIEMIYTADYKVKEEGRRVAVVLDLDTATLAADPVEYEAWLSDLYEYFLGCFNDAGLPPEAAQKHADAAALQCYEFIRVYTQTALTAISDRVKIDVEVDGLLDALLKLGFDELITSGETYGPCDVARFAEIGVHRMAPTITTTERPVGSARTRQFEATGPEPVVAWEVEPLIKGRAQGTIGRESGLYTAPASDEFTESFWRERIKATTASGAYSYRLVTVCKENLTISSLVKVCVGGNPDIPGDTGQDVPLFASSTLEDPSALAWSVEGEEGRESGTLKPMSGEAVVYTPPTKAKGKQYLIDKVVVRNPGAEADIFTAYMITPMISAPVDILVVDITAGGARLRPLHEIGESATVTWEVLVGPAGLTPDDALNGREATYKPPSDTQERFALIEVVIKKKVGTTRGFIVLPFPLHKYEVKAQGQSRVRKIFHRLINRLRQLFRAYSRSK